MAWVVLRDFRSDEITNCNSGATRLITCPALTTSWLGNRQIAANTHMIRNLNSYLVARFFLARNVLWLVWSILSLLLCSPAEGAGVTLAWNPPIGWNVDGYRVYYGTSSGNYTNTVDVGTNWYVTVDGLVAGTTYFFSVAAYDNDGLESPDSDEISITTSFAPIIISQPSSQFVQAGATAAVFVDVIGTPPVVFQWFNGNTPIGSGTNSILKLPQISDANSGDYFAVITDSEGSVTTALASVTVIDPTPVAAPLPSAESANTISQTPPTPSHPFPISSAAGTYNGLFYQTNGDGTPAIDTETTGLLSQCVVEPQGDFTATICLGGITNSIAGTFDATGNDNITVDRSAAGVSNLDITLNFTLASGSCQLSGLVSNLDTNNPWASALTAELQTTASTAFFRLFLNIGMPSGFPVGSAIARENADIVSLSGILGNRTMISQSAPLSVGGAMPVLIPLYQNAGLLAGWLNLSNHISPSALTWISPTAQGNPGFTNVVNVSVLGFR
jgi:hypothetical protein